MRLAALFSGGKDSCYAIYLAKRAGHEIKYLVTILSENPASYMYDTSNTELATLQAEAMGIPIILQKSSGKKEKEVNDLKLALAKIKDSIDGVVCGAVASEYQRARVAKVCEGLGLKLISPLWQTDPEKYLRDMVANGFKIIFTRVAAEGLGPEWLGRTLDEKSIQQLLELNMKKRISLIGEGGEFETKALDGPIFKKRLRIISEEKSWDPKTGSGNLIVTAELL